MVQFLVSVSPSNSKATYHVPQLSFSSFQTPQTKEVCYQIKIKIQQFTTLLVHSKLYIGCTMPPLTLDPSQISSKPPIYSTSLHTSTREVTARLPSPHFTFQGKMHIDLVCHVPSYRTKVDSSAQTGKARMPHIRCLQNILCPCILAKTGGKVC